MKHNTSLNLTEPFYTRYPVKESKGYKEYLASEAYKQYLESATYKKYKGSKAYVESKTYESHHEYKESMNAEEYKQYLKSEEFMTYEAYKQYLRSEGYKRSMARKRANAMALKESLAYRESLAKKRADLRKRFLERYRDDFPEGATAEMRREIRRARRYAGIAKQISKELKTRYLREEIQDLFEEVPSELLGNDTYHFRIKNNKYRIKYRISIAKKKPNANDKP